MQLWTWLAGRNGTQFLVWHGKGRLSRILQSLILINVLSSAFLEKRRKRKKQKEMTRGLGGGTFVPRTGHALLAVLNGIFVAVRCN
jgi:hypothetical protein